jgi:two-component system OmpR family response regulator
MLVAEDDASIARVIAASLREAGHSVDVLDNGLLADRALDAGNVDLLVLDLGLPGMDGARIIERLRSRGETVPILVITARDAVKERIRALDLGADDYLVKPFALGEFDARVRALVRRSLNRGAPVLRLGRLTLDVPGQRASVDDQFVDLTRRELGLLAALMRHPGHIASRQRLIDAICDWDQELTDNGLDIALHRLRRKLQGSGVALRTVRGLGYLLEAQNDG